MDLTNKIIQIASKEEKAGPFGPMVKIKDQDGKTYTVFKTKKDGTTSVAWDSMPAVGDTVQVSYAEEDGEYDGKPYKRRTVRSFNSDIGQGTLNVEKARGGQNIASQDKSNDNFWDKKALKQCIWGYWVAGSRDVGISEAEMSLIADVFTRIENFADKHYSNDEDIT